MDRCARKPEPVSCDNISKNPYDNASLNQLRKYKTITEEREPINGMKMGGKSREISTGKVTYFGGERRRLGRVDGEG
ncbi:hypothetical protein PRIPAC_71154 [Pristionchus pacificus]|uniref:Uncharacterized protein n=1 Tax=Pristionchus pacificus TaxID=54126 RepID=A0A2A6C0C4_PRIPA|nr:hypothetical protein PRIPAC_71154 [Pristionchus pacificus]|eukprot:PDM71463.1 hypothetical protein PRIPAC_37870 [Pristionchus pacificus]